MTKNVSAVILAVVVLLVPLPGKTGPVYPAPSSLDAEERPRPTSNSQSGNNSNEITHHDFSGAWFDPDLDGEGYIILQTPQGWVIWYFGYGAGGDRLWLVSETVEPGNFNLGEACSMAVFVGEPGTFSDPTPSSDLEEYGTLSLRFDTCTSGVFEVTGLDGFKRSEVIRLAGVDGTGCSLDSQNQRAIPPTLSEPAAGHSLLVPVVMVTHAPSPDGEYLDLEEANYTFRPPEWQSNRIDELLAYVETINVRKKFMLEEMSRFRGYREPGNPPFLGYTVVAHFLFHDPLPLSERSNPHDLQQKMVDFNALMAKINGRYWVDSRGVREFWFNNYFNEKFQFWESNMSSPLPSGDISNSDRVTSDLPIYSKTYVVYGTNYHRTQAEAVHNHGHQIEGILSHLDWATTGTHDLFWGAFVGSPDYPGGAMVPGRCGWTHQPPNTTQDYGYLDQKLVDVDCEDWRPDNSGPERAVNSDYFHALPYEWPGVTDSLPQRAESQFYIWWGQNMPGENNDIPLDQNRNMQNWWRIIGDWDAAHASELGLVE